MAKVICSFEHPKDQKRYYYIHNTLYESLETIPMDLTNFMWYYRFPEIQMKWFNTNYFESKKIMDDFFALKSQDYKEMVYALVYYTGVNEMAKINQPISDKLEEYLTTRENDNLLIGVSLILQVNKFNAFRPLDFYASWHSTWEALSKNSIKDADELSLLRLIKYENEVDIETYTAYFMELLEQFRIPFHAVPHILRKKENIRDYFIKHNYQMLLPFQVKELNAEKIIHKFKKKEPSEAALNFYFHAIKNCDFGISDNLKEEIELTGKQENELTQVEKKDILKTVLDSFSLLVNLYDADDKEILPAIYSDEFFIQSDEDFIYMVCKYGVQILDLYSAHGKLLYEEAHWYDFNYPFVYIQDAHENKLMVYYEETDMLYLFHQFNIPPLSIGEVFGKKAEDKIYFLNGFINEKLDLQSPFCFESKQNYQAFNEKCYSEGLASVSLNGKWGYIDHESNIVIPFEYGDAYPFINGKAKVFKLNDKFKEPIGEWKVIPSNENKNNRFALTEEQFKRRFPDFPTFVSKPLSYFRGRKLNDLQLAMQYHSFQHGVADIEAEYSDVTYFGKWITIDKFGNELIDEILIENINPAKKSIVETYEVENQDADYWVGKINENEYTAYNLPDHLYIDKDFILQLIENCPAVFKCLNYLYAEDVDCKLVYETSMNSTTHMSQTAIDNEGNNEDDLPF